jgi:hypothetical protein
MPVVAAERLTNPSTVATLLRNPETVAVSSER